MQTAIETSMSEAEFAAPGSRVGKIVLNRNLITQLKRKTLSPTTVIQDNFVYIRWTNTVHKPWIIGYIKVVYHFERNLLDEKLVKIVSVA